MTLRQSEYKIQDDGIWIPKSVLEGWRDHYIESAKECATNHKASKMMLDWLYLGKADTCSQTCSKCLNH